MDGVAKFNEFHGVSLSTNTNNSAGAGSSNNASNDNPTVNNINNNNQGIVREQDLFMPIANVTRIMRNVLPAHAKISDDAKETIQECVSEYISFITGEANERCQREKRKTITAEDILCAMSKLGFDNYIEPLTLFLRRYREAEGNPRGFIHGEPLPILKRTASAANLAPLQPTTTPLAQSLAPLALPTAPLARSLAPAGTLELPPTAPMELPPAAPYPFPLTMASNATVPPPPMSFYQQLGDREHVMGGGQYFGMPSYGGWGGAGAGTGVGDAGASNSQSQHFPGAFDPHYFDYK